MASDLPDTVWAYRVTQGLHVATGVVCVPLLLAKLGALAVDVEVKLPGPGGLGSSGGRGGPGGGT